MGKLIASNRPKPLEPSSDGGYNSIDSGIERAKASIQRDFYIIIFAITSIAILIILTCNL